MSPWDTAWLNAVFTTPGYGAAHTFDVANVHLRDTLANLPGEVTAWHRYFTFFGDGTLPLWVTETGYPSDPAYQYDASFRGSDSASGQAAQAAFLAKSLPSLVVAGAARVFVTERDDLAGQFASEGLLGGHVTDGDESNPNPIPKPAYATFQQLVAQAAAALAAPPPPAAPATAPPAPSTDAPVSTSPPPTASPPAVAASAAAPAARSAHRRPARIAGHGRPAAERHRKRPGRRLRTRRHRPRG
jgi:hypothetical protein